MRIGELATAAGVTTRTVRHYHQIGLLPEPPRTAGGYRDYSVRDLVRLSHARRLVELGLALDEVRLVLADEEGRSLAEIVEAMDSELAAQELRLVAQRRRLADLRARIHGGRLDVDDLPEPELVQFFSHVEAAGGTGPMARLDRDMLAVFPGGVARDWVAPMLPLLGDEDYTRGLVEMYDGFDRLADAPADDPDVSALVDRIMALLPDESRRELAAHDLESFGGDGVVDAVLAELSPGQVAAVHQLMERVRSDAAATRPDKSSQAEETT